MYTHTPPPTTAKLVNPSSVIGKCFFFLPATSCWAQTIFALCSKPFYSKYNNFDALVLYLKVFLLTLERASEIKYTRWLCTKYYLYIALKTTTKANVAVLNVYNFFIVDWAARCMYSSASLELNTTQDSFVTTCLIDLLFISNTYSRGVRPCFTLISTNTR